MHPFMKVQVSQALGFLPQHADPLRGPRPPAPPWGLGGQKGNWPQRDAEAARRAVGNTVPFISGPVGLTISSREG